SASYNDPFDVMLFISTDEGSSFQRQPVSFTPDTLLFHPKEEDKLLAYCKEGTVSGNVEGFGPRDTSYQMGIDLFFSSRSVSGVDSDPDLVHMEMQDASGGYLYVTCLIQNCSDKMVTAQFLGKIDHNSLLVQDSYIFVKVTTGNRTKHYVSYRRNEFVQMRFPKYALPKDVQIVSTDENQVFLALQEWYQTDTYNLYQSDPQGVYYALVLENVRQARGVCLFLIVVVLVQVRGVKGVFLANQKIDGKVTTVITYNKGRDWEHLTPPATDMNGKSITCKVPDCHLHLHLRWADNPYVSGTVHTKDSAPGLIMGAGNLGSKLVEYKEDMYVTSDCGRTWRQVFEEEHHILYLDHGGVIVAIKDTSIPLKILKFSIDEGRTWTVHNFTSTSVFVDGLLSEPGDETLVMTVFGHISYRSDWELVKVDFRQSFPRQCTEEDYESWQLTDLHGEKCIMGQERSFRRRKDSAYCIKGKSYTSVLSTKPCQCTERDFNCDFGFERSQTEGHRCFADFWFDLDAPPDDCHLGQSYESSTGYRKVISNSCEGGINKQQSSKTHLCPLLPPRGLQLGIKGQMLAVVPEMNHRNRTLADFKTIDTQQPPHDICRLWKHLVLTKLSMQAVCFIRKPHRYGEKSLLLLPSFCCAAPLQEVHLEVVPIAGINQEVNLSAAVLPVEANLTVFYWWIGDNMQPTLTIQNSLLTRFPEPGEVSITVQASNGRSMVQDTKIIRVYGHFQVIPLSFSSNVDRFNPNIPEWREDVGQVVTKILYHRYPSGIPRHSGEAGPPTSADLYVLPLDEQPDKRSSPILQNSKSHSPWLRSEDAYPPLFFRKLPVNRNVYAQMHNEKEQEMTSPVSHSEDTQHIIQAQQLYQLRHLSTLMH
uniref:Sortilin-related VPS10 domain containing receptor 2 n=1 Tax=Neogobius melanostomus TaxID=47308 RepID=A0A8C6SCG3_9GOBI